MNRYLPLLIILTVVSLVLVQHVNVDLSHGLAADDPLCASMPDTSGPDGWYPGKTLDPTGHWAACYAASHPGGPSGNNGPVANPLTDPNNQCDDLPAGWYPGREPTDPNDLNKKPGAGWTQCWTERLANNTGTAGYTPTKDGRFCREPNPHDPTAPSLNAYNECLNQGQGAGPYVAGPGSQNIPPPATETCDADHIDIKDVTFSPLTIQQGDSYTTTITGCFPPGTNFTAYYKNPDSQPGNVPGWQTHPSDPHSTTGQAVGIYTLTGLSAPDSRGRDKMVWRGNKTVTVIPRQPRTIGSPVPATVSVTPRVTASYLPFPGKESTGGTTSGNCPAPILNNSSWTPTAMMGGISMEPSVFYRGGHCQTYKVSGNGFTPRSQLYLTNFAEGNDTWAKTFDMTVINQTTAYVMVGGVSLPNNLKSIGGYALDNGGNSSENFIYLDATGGGQPEFSPPPNPNTDPVVTSPPAGTITKAPVISSFSPLAARPGTTVTVKGSNFGSLSKAVISGITINAASGTTSSVFRFVLPVSLAPGAYGLQIRNSAGQLSSYAPRSISVIEHRTDPTVYYVVPTTLPRGRATAITVYGTNLTEVLRVTPLSPGLTVDEDSISSFGYGTNKMRARFSLTVTANTPSGQYYLTLEDDEGTTIRFPVVVGN